MSGHAQAIGHLTREPYDGVDSDTHRGPHQQIPGNQNPGRNEGSTIRLLLGGALVARAVDREGVDKPILSAGRVGLRGDNAEFEFRTLEVRSL